MRLLPERGHGSRATCPKGDSSSRSVERLDRILGALHPTNPESWKRLRELRTVCGSQKILPQSYILSGPLSTGEWPVASRGSYDVYEGSLNGSKVCVKRLRVYSSGDPEMAKNTFFQEAVVWKRLEHPNIVPLLGVTVAPLQLVSVWMAGGELLEYIDTHPSIDRLSLIFDVVHGLGYLHSYGIIHGDLKGPSILVDNTGHARLTDFDLAAVLTPELGSTKSTTDSHAVRWAAPEVLDNELSVSKKSDVFSFAMVVVEIFAGEVPFHDIRPTTVAVGVLSGNRPGRPMHPSLTDDIWNLIEQCWDHDPQRRPDISDVTSYLRTKFALPHGDDGMLDDTTLGGVQQTASRYQPPRHTPALCGINRLWKFGKLSPVSRSAAGGDTIDDFESEEYEKLVDTERESLSTSNPVGMKGRWLP